MLTWNGGEQEFKVGRVDFDPGTTSKRMGRVVNNFARDLGTEIARNEQKMLKDALEDWEWSFLKKAPNWIGRLWCMVRGYEIAIEWSPGNTTHILKKDGEELQRFSVYKTARSVIVDGRHDGEKD